MSKPELVYFAGSPFSWRAKWALDAAEIDYRITPYNPSPFYIGELPLRWHVGRLTGTITAPIMLLPREQGGTNMMDSTDIARWADAHSSSSPGQLFPEQHAADVDRWIKAANQLLSLFRRELAAAGMSNPRVIEARLPPGSSGLQAMLMRYMTYQVFQNFSTKYKQQDATAQLEQVVADLTAARGAITTHPNKLLLAHSDHLTYAEVALATAINKIAECRHELPEANTSAAAAGHLAGTAAAPAGPGVDGGATLTDLLPSIKQVLQDFGDLVTWAEGTTKNHWAAGPGNSK